MSSGADIRMLNVYHVFRVIAVLIMQTNVDEMQVEIMEEKMSLVYDLIRCRILCARIPRREKNETPDTK